MEQRLVLLFKNTINAVEPFLKYIIFLKFKLFGGEAAKVFKCGVARLQMQLSGCKAGWKTNLLLMYLYYQTNPDKILVKPLIIEIMFNYQTANKCPLKGINKLRNDYF